jgi:hypothetical protein
METNERKKKVINFLYNNRTLKSFILLLNIISYLINKDT